jgi:hypothetical protein
MAADDLNLDPETREIIKTHIPAFDNIEEPPHDAAINLESALGGKLSTDERRMVTSALFELTVNARGVAVLCKRLEEYVLDKLADESAMDAACLASLASNSSMKMGWLADRVMGRLDPGSEDESDLDWLLPPHLKESLS